MVETQIKDDINQSDLRTMCGTEAIDECCLVKLISVRPYKFEESTVINTDVVIHPLVGLKSVLREK
jgi:hypothetical protein